MSGGLCLTIEAELLLSKATDFAWRLRHATCDLNHVIWAYIERAKGDLARDVRRACRKGTPQPKRADEMPPYAASLDSLFKQLAERGVVVSPEVLFVAACNSELPEALREPLDVWMEQHPIAAPPPSQAIAEWSRFELDDGSNINIAEITRVEHIVYLCTASRRADKWDFVGPPVFQVTELQTIQNAQRSVEARTRNLQKKDYLKAGLVKRPLPEASTLELKRQQTKERTEERHRRILAFEEQALAFYRAWHAKGYDPTRTFLAEGQRLSQNANEIAKDCVLHAAKHFDVWFTFITTVDEEHGDLGPIGKAGFAEFYIRPSNVARLALAKIRREHYRTDGEWPYWRSSADQRQWQEPDDESGAAMLRWQAEHG